MTTKYFTVEIRPTMKVVNAGLNAAFADGDILWNWETFFMPRGGGRLIGAHVEIRPKGDSGATPNKFPLELLFATDNYSHPNYPGTEATWAYSLGTINAAPSTFAEGISGVAHKFLGQVPIVAGDFADSIDPIAIASTSDTNGIVLQQSYTDMSLSGFSNIYKKQKGGFEPSEGYTKFRIAGIAGGAFDFRSACIINGGDLDGPVMTTSGTQPQLFIIPGDTVAVCVADDPTTTKAMGVVESTTDTSITLTEAFTTTDVANNDIVYNTQPIRILLTFER